MLHNCCFSLVNNPVLSSFLLMEPSALEPSTVIMNGYTVIFFSSDTSLSGRCLSFALYTFPILRCDVSFILPYIQLRFFLTLSDLEILSVNCFARFVSTESFDGSVSTDFFSFSFLFGKQVLQCLPLAS